MAEPISVTSVTKTYPGGTVPALKSVSLDVAPGTFVVLLGPSGSGKTTLLRCLAGIERIDSGSLTIGSRVVADGRSHVPPEQRDLSMVFQDYALWPHLTALDNVAFALRRRRLSRPECRARAQVMLSRVGLEEFAKRYPNELSGGQQQRVALARALIADTGLILCDEPLSNLDADLRERMRVEISALVRDAGATTVYITHDQAEAFALADQIGVLEEGVLVQSGSPEDVYHHPATPFVARFTGLAGELPVRVAGHGRDGALEITAAGDGSARLPALRPAAAAAPAGRPAAGDGAADGGAGGLRPGDDALLAIRPTGVLLLRSAEELPHLSGQVADVAFRGRGYEYAIDLPGLGRITGVFARHRADRGDSVGLRLDPEGCHLFPARATAGEAETPAPAPALTAP
ncbi:MAG TPA: ABC transporter ATP-binding protein [Trebonia sp.]|nr:ABC transporter ATP-binding protein [Trebonia sp.]